jgi:hypothetical protein
MFRPAALLQETQKVTLMKRKALAFILIIVIALSAATWLVYNQISELQNQKNAPKAKIIAFTADMSWRGPVVGVIMDITFNVTVQNIGTNDINGANITVERITADNDSSICSYYTENLTVLHPRETYQAEAFIFTDVSHFYEVTGSNFIASLKLNDTVLDERKLF